MPRLIGLMGDLFGDRTLNSQVSFRAEKLPSALTLTVHLNLALTK